MNKRTILLGFFVLATLTVLGYFTLFLTDFALFKEQPELTVRFAETNGLREGDSVLVAGMRWGRVKKLDFDPLAPNERRITVVATLHEPLVLREGFSIRIEDATLLGGKHLAIDPGPAGALETPRDLALSGEVAPSPLDALGRLVRESSGGLERIVEDLGAIAENVRTGRGAAGRLINDEAVAENLAATIEGARKTLENLQSVTADLAEGRGTVGRLMTNEELYVELLATTRRLNEMVLETTTLVKSAGQGNGIVGRLLADEELANRFARMVTDVGDVTARIARGEGTIGRLANDDTVATNLETITARIVDGEGIGALFTKPDVYDNVLQITDDFAAVTGAVRNGQGTFGRLVMDPEVYNQVKTALQVVQRSLEEYREAAPITTFTSIFFATF